MAESSTPMSRARMAASRFREGPEYKYIIRRPTPMALRASKSKVRPQYVMGVQILLISSTDGTCVDVGGNVTRAGGAGTEDAECGCDVTRTFAGGDVSAPADLTRKTQGGAGVEYFGIARSTGSACRLVR